MQATSVGLEVYNVVWLFLTGYLLGYSSRRITSVGLKSYFIFLTQWWKLLTFIPAALFVTFAGQFSHDDTWDIVNGAGMSLLTFLTAPWAVGVMIRWMQGSATNKSAFVAVLAMLFSASWFYDGWLLLRDGYYPSTWLPNLLLSPVIYVSAGLLWSLETSEDGKPNFAFLRVGWFHEGGRTLIVDRRHILLMLPLIAAAAAILLLSVRWQFLDWSLIDLLPLDVRMKLFDAY